MPPLPQVSFLNSFTVQVPTFHTPRRPEYRVWLNTNINADHKNRASAESTAREVPLIAILKMEVKDLIKFVESSLEKFKKKKKNQLTHVTLNPYQKWEITSEGYLMGITVREIAEPIIEALEQVCRRLVGAKSLPNGSCVLHFSQDRSYCENGVTEYEWKLKYPTREYCSIAILELKRPYCMKWDDFKTGFTDDSRSALASFKRLEVGKDRFRALLGANAVPLVQQCSKFSKTPFVALLDWTNLFLFEFPEAGEKYKPVTHHFENVRQEQASNAMVSGIWFDAGDMPTGANYRNMILAIALKGLEA